MACLAIWLASISLASLYPPVEGVTQALSLQRNSCLHGHSPLKLRLSRCSATLPHDFPRVPHRRKARCDGKKPRCSGCARLGTQCVMPTIDLRKCVQRKVLAWQAAGIRRGEARAQLISDRLLL